MRGLSIALFFGRYKIKYKQYNKKRDGNELEICRQLDQLGICYKRLDLFDLLIGHRGRDFKVEIKDPAQPGSLESKKTDIQKDFEDTWCGAPLYYAETIDDILEIIAVDYG